MSARPSIWAPLRTRDYRNLWFGQTISVVGDKVDQIAMGVMVYQVTGSLLQMGVMLGVTMLPAALFGVFAGVYVDRWERSRTMLVADLLRAGLVVSVPFVIRFGVPYAYVVAFLVASVSLFFEPAKLSLIPDLVDDAQLMAANSLDSASSAGAELFGLAFAGPVVALLTYRGAFFFDAVTYLVSAAFILAIVRRSERGPARGEARPSVLTEIAEGVGYIRDTPVLRDIMGVYCLAVVGGAASITLSYLIALRTFAHAGPSDALRLAILDGAVTAGLLLGSFWVGRSGSEKAGAKFLGGLVSYGLLFGAIAVVGNMWVAAIFFLLSGVANMWFQVPMYTILQQQTPPSVRGRVFAARTTIIRVFTVAGLVGAGAAAERFGIPPVVAVVGLIVLAAGLAGWTRPALRAA